MAEADRLAIAPAQPAAELMQSAGEAVAARFSAASSPRPVTCAVRSGNNGGDGFVAAACAGARRMAGPSRAARRCRSTSRRCAISCPTLARRHRTADSARVIDGAELLIDALFGSGLNRALDPRVSDTLGYATRRALPIVAVDVPSGILGNSGENIGAAPAVCTVTFVRKKPGHLLLPGRELCGDVAVADIGIPQQVLDSLAVDTWENVPALWQAKLPQRAFEYQQVQPWARSAVRRLSDDRRGAHGRARRGAHRRRTDHDCGAGDRLSPSMPPRSPASWRGRSRSGRLRPAACRSAIHGILHWTRRGRQRRDAPAHAWPCS